MGILDWFRRSNRASAPPRTGPQASPRPFDVPAGLDFEEAAFLRGLEASPADDTLRLVYADWLQERDDHRHEFLRAAVAMRTAVVSGDGVPGRVRRVRDLRKAVPTQWVVWADRSLAEDDVREAVLRGLVGTRRLPLGDFIGVEDDADPSPYLMTALTDLRPELLPASSAECRDGFWFNQGTDVPMTLFAIFGVHWVLDSACDVHSSIHMGPTAGAGHLHRVALRDNNWIVLDETRTWIS